MANGAMRPPLVSVIVATYNRLASVTRLLQLLAEQTLPPDRFEVIVIDDGSATPVAPALSALTTPYPLVVVTQENGGPAVARHTGILRASADLVVIVDDDMRVEPTFLAEHLEAHAGSARRVVLGRLRTEPGARPRLFERARQALLDRQAADVQAGRSTLRGANLYTGNVSLRRADYLAVGGFDPALRLSEDAELGMRLEEHGAEFVLSEPACSWHASDHDRLIPWMRRGVAYGASDARIARKHGMRRATSPWRFLLEVHAVSRPLLLASALSPTLLRPVSWLAVLVATALGRLGAERVAIAGATFAYGLQYFAGVGLEAGTRRRVLAELGEYLSGCAGPELGAIARFGKFLADVRADRAALARADAKYRSAPRRSGLVRESVERIGLQMMIAYRWMRLFRDTGPVLVAKIISRLIRHWYAAELHWDADLAPGVIIVHGTGLVISHAARVEAGCILFQHVTLGESIDAESRMVGAPVLEADVHVGPGATLLGPITIGRGSKIMATALVMRSVPPNSLVETAAPCVHERGARVRAERGELAEAPEAGALDGARS
ncbi:MAG TPA: glycosyltransferase [Gemmatimonadaceae bacterium]|nr:glycosyltransferase [Gemmatimonadaceae bacterium]